MVILMTRNRKQLWTKRTWTIPTNRKTWILELTQSRKTPVVRDVGISFPVMNVHYRILITNLLNTLNILGGMELIAGATVLLAEFLVSVVIFLLLGKNLLIRFWCLKMEGSTVGFMILTGRLWWKYRGWCGKNGLVGALSSRLMVIICEMKFEGTCLFPHF